MPETTQALEKGDYVCSQRDPNEIGVVQRVKRTRVPHSTDLVVDWLTHSGSSHEFSSGLKRLDPTDPRVSALINPAKSKGGRPAKWSGPTRAIRVPEHLAQHLLDIARQLDNPAADNSVQNPSGLPICKPASDAATIAQGLAEGWIVPRIESPDSAWMPSGEGIGVGSFVGRLPSGEQQFVVAGLVEDSCLLWDPNGWRTYPIEFVRAKSSPNPDNLKIPAWHWLSHLCSVLGAATVRKILDEVADG